MRANLPALVFCLAAATTPVYADEISDVLAGIDNRYGETETLARALWEWAEVGYQETRSTELMQQALADEGFEIQAGIAGIPTAFVAEAGKGGPVIGILAEMDALPGINQSDLPHRDPVDGKGAGQACGHNLFGAGSVEAAIAVKQWLDENDVDGTIRLYGTPAEEGGSGKVYMVREGVFDEVDFVLHWHPSSENWAGARGSLANRSAKFRFSGISAHAAGNPDRARSALDGVEAMNMMANMMREHIPDSARMHYVITEGGHAPNVVPDFAEVFYYLRHPDTETLLELWPRLEATARGAAEGTGTTVEWEVIHGNNPLLVVETLAKMMDQKLRQVGGVQYNAEEQAWAEDIYATFDNPSRELGSETEIREYDTGVGFGSTDVGDVSQVVPTVGLRTATWVPGTPGHSWQAVAASGTSIGVKGTQVAAKTLALAAIELYQNPKLRETATAEWQAARGESFEYVPLLGDRVPPLDYRN
ncbi:amidohydrolase [Marinihelvus fidelis]|uniref:Amidohydrolase n=1 Tax=Marinihelvus fidelis TaxID=2613842 RepID=A0A5N0TCF8_9GAMM|nr:amidohydrolase [Marinihelvus fidelis]KAA9132695.1 amidohydrolase [Marinihelvus fidelis]